MMIWRAKSKYGAYRPITIFIIALVLLCIITGIFLIRYIFGIHKVDVKSIQDISKITTLRFPQGSYLIKSNYRIWITGSRLEAKIMLPENKVNSFIDQPLINSKTDDYLDPTVISALRKNNIWPNKKIRRFQAVNGVNVVDRYGGLWFLVDMDDPGNAYIFLLFEN